MRRLKILGALAGIALASVLVAPAAIAQAAPQANGLAYAPERVCASTPTPSGYYVVSFSQQTLPRCRNVYNVPASPGYTKLIAPAPIQREFIGCADGSLAQPGFVVTRISNRSPVCGYYSAPLYPGTTITYTPANRPRMTVCAAGGVPFHYVQVPNSARSSRGQCEVPRPGVPFSSNDLITIRRI